MKPRYEMADIFRLYGDKYRKTHVMSEEQRKVMGAIEACRTSQLGGHTEICDNCGTVQNSYNSCRNRHCPKCQTMAKEKWLVSGGVKMYKKCRFENAGKKRAVFQATGASRLPETG